MKLTKQIKKIKEIEELIKQYNSEKKYEYVIQDGIVDIKKYLSSTFKILWILKEPHDKGEHGKFDMRHLLQGAKSKNGLNPNMKSTFTNIIYSTYGILNDFTCWNDIDDFRNNHDLIDVLQNIAIINIRKLPGKNKSNEKEIANNYQKYKSIILKQIDVYDPDVIIGGGTIHHLYTDLKLSESEKKILIKFNNIKNHPKAYFTAKNKIIIETCHPNARVKHEQYCDNIINGVKYWSSLEKTS